MERKREGSMDDWLYGSTYGAEVGMGKPFKEAASPRKKVAQFLYSAPRLSYDSLSSAGGTEELEKKVEERDKLRDQALQWLTNGNMRGAINSALESIYIMEKELGSIGEILPECMVLTRAYFKLGDRAEARYYLNRCDKLVQMEPYDDAATNASLYSMLAELHMLNNDFSRAKSLYYKYLRRMEEIFGRTHIATSDCYNVLAAFFTHQGEYGTALEYCSKALVIRMEQLGMNHQFTADSHYNMGLLYRLYGRPMDARREFGIARDIRKAIFGPKSLEVAEVELSMGFTEHQIGNLLQAHDLCEHAYMSRRDILGRRHADTLEALNLLDTVRIAQGVSRFDESRPSLKNSPSSIQTPKTLVRYDRFILDRSLDRLERSGKVSSNFVARVKHAAASQGPLTVDDLQERFLARYPMEVGNLLDELFDQDIEQKKGQAASARSFSSSSSSSASPHGKYSRSHLHHHQKFSAVDLAKSEWLSPNVGHQSDGSPVPFPISPVVAGQEEKVFFGRDERVREPSGLGSSETLPKRPGKDFEDFVDRNEASSGSHGYQMSWMATMTQKERELLMAQEKELGVKSPSSSGLGLGSAINSFSAKSSLSPIGQQQQQSSTASNSARVDASSRPFASPREEGGSTANLFESGFFENYPLSSSGSHHAGGTGQGSHGGNSGLGSGSGFVGSGSGFVGSGSGFVGSGTGEGGSFGSGNGYGSPHGGLSVLSAVGGGVQQDSPVSGRRTKTVELSGDELWKSFETQVSLGFGLIPLLMQKKKQEEASTESKKKPTEEKNQAPPEVKKPTVKQDEKKAAKKKKPLGPKSDTKRVHWDVLEDTEGTLWDSGVESSDIEFSDLKTEFSSKQVAKKSTEDEEKAPKRKEVTLIADPKRRQNMSIFAKTLMKGGRNLEDVGTAIKHMEISKFGPSALESLREFLPEGDETDAVTSYVESGGDTSLLGPAEQFVLAMSDVPRLAQRIQSLAVLSQFDEQVSDLKKRIDSVRKTCSHVKDSKRFVQLLQIILKVGNELNKGTHKGDAQGIRLSSLIKLTQTKSNQNTTLLDYLVENLESKQPELLEVAEDFPLLGEAARGNMQLMSADAAKIKSSFQLVDGVSKAASKAGDDSEFIAATSPFLERAKGIVDDVDKKFSEMKSQFEDLCKYLGENPAASTPEELFEHLEKFLSTLSSTVRKVREVRERKERRERHEKLKQERQQRLHGNS